MDLYQQAREDLQKGGSVTLYNRLVYPYLRFLQREFGTDKIFLDDPDLFIVGYDFPKEIESRSFRYIQFVTEGYPAFRSVAKKPIVLLDSKIQVSPIFPHLFLIRDESNEWDIKIDGKKYALRKPGVDQDFLLTVLDAYLIPDLAKLVLQYLPFSEELIGTIIELNEPISVAISNRSGNIYVLNAGDGRITIHNSKGKLIEKFNVDYKNLPQRIAISPITDNIFITEYTGSHRVVVYDTKGNLIRSWGSRGEGKGQFKGPRGIAISVKGEVYVADTKNDRIQVFDEKGGYLQQWDLGERGSNKHADIALSRNEVFVIDSGIGRVKVFSLDGQPLRKWGQKSWEEGEFISPTGIAISPVSNEVYVTDEGSNSLQLFTKDGEYLRREIRYDGSFNSMQGVAISNKGDVYVANRGNYNVLIFQTVQVSAQEQEFEE
jgi:DNA-binding beta-propeller fold protein YncE